MKFNEKLIKLRKEKGMTQEDLAFELGVSRQSISKWEIGDCEPDIPKLRELGKVFNVSIDYLLSDDDEQKDTQKKSGIDTVIINNEKYSKLLPYILILICGIGLIVSFVLVFLFPHMSCGGKGSSSIVKYLIRDWCSTAVLWRFFLFIPSVICGIASFFLLKKERENNNNEKNN